MYPGLARARCQRDLSDLMEWNASLRAEHLHLFIGAGRLLDMGHA